MFVDAEGSGWDPEKWKDEARQERDSAERDLGDVKHEDWDTKRGRRALDDLSNTDENLQDLEGEYLEGILEQAPWRVWHNQTVSLKH